MLLIKILVVGYGVVVAVVAVFQRRMIYFPSRYSAAEADVIARESGFEPWRNAKGELIGWKWPAAGEAKFSVLLTHGNGGWAADRGWIVNSLHESSASVEVYVLEYPGYGARDGSPSKESFLRAGEEAFKALPTDKPRFLVSESLGTGVAAHLAGTFSNEVAGAVCFVPYHSLPWVAQRHMRLLPAYYLVLDRFEPAESFRNFHGPLRIVIAENDEVIPPESGRKLFESYSGPKELEVEQGALHNEVAGRTAEWWRTTFQSLEKLRESKSK